MRHADWCFRTGSSLEPNKRYLGLAGAIIHMPGHQDIVNSIQSLKVKHWPPDGKHEKARPKSTDRCRICLHTTDIIRKRGPFAPTEIDYNLFLADVSAVMSELDMTLLACVIDKVEYRRRYGPGAYPAYEKAAEFMVERFGFFLRENGGQGVIILESRGRREDNEVLRHLINVLDRGTYYNDAAVFSRILGVFFNPKRTNDDQKSFIGLEVADLCCGPLVRATIHGIGIDDRAFQAIKTKVRGYPNVMGRGLKLVP